MIVSWSVNPSRRWASSPVRMEAIADCNNCQAIVYLKRSESLSPEAVGSGGPSLLSVEVRQTTARKPGTIVDIQEVAIASAQEWK